MDELNAHQFWGISPAVDLGAVLRAKPELLPSNGEPVKILQVASYDARHTLYTICRAARNFKEGQPVHLYVYEEEPELLARHLLLVSILLDGSLMAKERMEALLELHSNVLLREKAAKYLEAQGRALEAMMVGLSSKGELPTGSTASSTHNNAGGAGAPQPTSIPVLSSLLDIGLLKFQDRDRLVEVLQKYRESQAYDMIKGWDARARKFYGDRYDFRRNMIDWDYHMPLIQAGTPGQDPINGSIIHFHHFRYWRVHGIAYELRDAQYNHPNRSVLSTAVGRTKEFKDRSGKDVGRSVTAWGYWGDMQNGPYHCFGTVAEDDALFKVSNKQFNRTAVDVAEHNLLALLHELRTGQPLEPGSEAHRARVARGPTSMADLQEESAKTAKARGKESGETRAEAAGEELGAHEAGGRAAALGKIEEGQEEEAEEEGTDSLATAPDGSQAVGQQDGTGATTARGAASSSSAPAPTTSIAPPLGLDIDEDGPPPFLPSATFQGPKPGYSFKRGKQGIGYYLDAHTASTPSTSATSTPSQVVASTAAAIDGTSTSTSSSGSASQGKAAASSGATGNPDSGARAGPGAGTAGAEPAAEAGSEEVQKQMAAEAEAVRAAEAVLDEAAATRLLRGGWLRIIPVLGDSGLNAGGASYLSKVLTGRAKFAGAFALASVGHRHIHLLGPEHGLQKAVTPGGLVLAEGARHMLMLNKEQAAKFNEKIDEIAQGSGLARAASLEQQLQQPQKGCSSGMVLTQAHLLLQKPAA